MATRANWHIDVPVDESDPFRNIEDLGEQLDLRASPDVLQAKLAESVRIESSLHSDGVTCEIKDDPHACCLACPVRHTTPGDPMSALCSLGLEQERLLTQMAVARAEL